MRRDEALAEVAAYLNVVPAWYLATEAEGQPHVRPFSFAEVDDGRLWFCTATTKDVYEELTANPRFEACAWQPGNGWLILRGYAAFGEPSAATRQDGYDHLCGLGESYDGPDDPTLTFFTFESGAIWRCDIDGTRMELYRYPE